MNDNLKQVIILLVALTVFYFIFLHDLKDSIKNIGTLAEKINKTGLV